MNRWKAPKHGKHDQKTGRNITLAKHDVCLRHWRAKKLKNLNIMETSVMKKNASLRLEACSRPSWIMPNHGYRRKACLFCESERASCVPG